MPFVDTARNSYGMPLSTSIAQKEPMYVTYMHDEIGTTINQVITMSTIASRIRYRVGSNSSLNSELRKLIIVYMVNTD